MEAVRCTECGATRWSLFASSLGKAVQGTCEVCGGPTVPERRRPGGNRGPLGVERRGGPAAVPGRRSGSPPAHVA